MLLALPNTRAEQYEPLDRIRAVIPGVMASLKAALPHPTLGRGPSLFGALPMLSGCESKVKKGMCNIFQRTGLVDPEKHYDEAMRLAPLAQKYQKAGFATRQCWARAALDSPELLRGRDAVSMLLGAIHTTGNVERYLKSLAQIMAPSRRRLGPAVVSDLHICCSHFPRPEDVVERWQDRSASMWSIVPRSTYLKKIVSSYRATLSGREFRTHPKERRDRGLARDMRDR